MKLVIIASINFILYNQFKGSFMNYKKIFTIFALVAAIAGIFYYKQQSVIVYADDNIPHKIQAKQAGFCVFVWSATCPACVHNLPHISILKEHVEQANGQVILVLSDEHVQLRGMAKAYFIRFGITNLNTYYDKKYILQKKYAIKALPTLLIFNKHNKLVKKVEGFVPWAHAENIQEMLSLIA